MVSIIVPIYNTEKYLEKCLNSIQQQTYSDIEIILVDDGSTDLSGNICDNYAQMDKRIKVIHKDNEGVMVARKTGIKYSRGDFVLSVDSDDFIEKTMVEVLLQTAMTYGADIVTSGLIREENDFTSNVFDALGEGLYQNEKFERELIPNLIYESGSVHHGILPNLSPKLIKRELLENACEYIGDNIRNGDDAALAYICCIYAKSIYVTKELFYHYFIRRNSLVHSIDMYYLQSLNELYVSVYRAFSDSKYKDVLCHQLSKYLILNCLSGINENMQCPKDLHIPDSLFRTSMLEENSRIILYGAGLIGKSYYKQLKQEGYDIILWVDKQYEKYRSEGYNVDDVKCINNVKGKYVIVLAVKYQGLADQIRQELYDAYHISEDLIKWHAPSSLV